MSRFLKNIKKYMMKSPNKKNKIIFYNPSFETGGVEKNIFSFIEHCLKFSRYKAILLTIDKPYKIEKGIFYTKYPKKIFYLKSRIIKYIIAFYYLLKICIKDNFLIISFQNNILAIIAAVITNNKIIVRLNTSPEKYIKSPIKKIFFKFFYKLSNLIIVNDEDFKNSVDKYFNIKASIVHNSVNLKKIEKKSRFKTNFNFFKKKSLNIISVGRLTDQKDHITLLKAINVSNKKSHIKLVIIGSGYKKDFLQNFIWKNKLHKTVKLLGYKENPYKYIKLSDILILSSKFEGSPNILLEAAVLKKLIISSDCKTGPRKLLSSNKGGYLFKVGDYYELSKIIDKLKLNNREAQKKINYIYKLVKKNYNEKNQRKEFLKIIKKIEKNFND